MPEKPGQQDERKPPHEKPISLHPMNVEDALKKALQAKPERDEPKKKGSKTPKKGR